MTQSETLIAAPEPVATSSSEYDILQAVVQAATAFLQTAEIDAGLTDLLERIGRATGASRVSVFEIDPRVDSNRVTASQCAEWTAPGVIAHLGSPVMRNVGINYDGFEFWYDAFECGAPFVAIVSALPDPARGRLHAAGVLSMAHVPIMVDDVFWGFLGVDNCVAERTWTTVEVDALMAAAVVVGAAIRRRNIEHALREATLQAQLAADIGEVVTRADDTLQEMLDLCSAAIVRRLNPDFVRIWMMSENLECLLACKANGVAPIQHMHLSDVPLISNALIQIVERESPTQWRDGIPPLWPESEAELREAGFRHGVGFPLITTGRVAGVMVVLGREFPPQSMIDALASVTDEIALAIERHHVTGAATRAETRYRRLVEATVEGIVIHDYQKVVDSNPSFAKMLGYTYEEILGRNPMSFIPEEYHDFVREQLAIKSETPYEAEAVCKDGSRFPVEIKGTDFSDGSRELRVTAIRDITDRRRIEEAIDELRLEQQARAIAEQTRERAEFLADASRILAASLDTNTTLTQLAHLSIPRLSDYTIVSVFENGLERRVAIVHPDPEKEDLLRKVVSLWPEVQNAEHPMFAAIARMEPFVAREMTEDMIAKFGIRPEHRPYFDILGPRSVMGVPIYNGGKLLGSIIMSSIREDRLYSADDLALAQEFAHRAALALQAAESYHKAEAASRARDEMLAVVAHDLRNPLNTIFMGSEVSLEMFSAELGPGGVRQLEIIRRSAQHMNRLIQDLLDASRIDSGTLGLEKCSLQTEDLLREAGDMLSPLAAHVKIALNLQTDGTLPTLEADKGRLLQVLSNLVGNALKFTPQGGTISVTAQMTNDSPRRCVRFSVSDTGAGIPAEQLPHIFARGWQARRGDRRGIGVGLAIASGIVDAHGGRIWVESQVGVGTTFHFTIPVPPAPAM
jgi:PAS domain S-box-containing protein